MLTKYHMSRLRIMFLLCILLFAVLLGRIVYLQLWRSEYYAEQSDENRLRQSRIIAPRGLILDSDGRELVNNLPGYAVALQKQSNYNPDVLERLSVLLQMPVEDIKEKIKASANYSEPILLKSNLSPEQLTKIEEQRRNMPDVMLEIRPIRNYVYNDLAVHALGYVGEVSEYEIEHGLFKNAALGSIVGKAGLEKSYDSILRGEDGTLAEEVDVAGNVVQHYNAIQPSPGKNLQLTINFSLQTELEKFIDSHLWSLRASGSAPNARAAAMVAIDPRNGAVRALISRPNYNPNLFVQGISSKDWNDINNNPDYPMTNRVTGGEYPPGSTFKIVTGSAAFELNKITLYELIYDGGYHPLVPTMGNAGGEVLGWLSFVSGLAQSDNVYFYELSYRTGIDNIAKYARIYGFGEPTGIDLDEESKGLVASKQVKKEIWNEEWRLGDTFNAAIGQGFNLATPLQLAVMLACVANGGIKYQPYLVENIFNPDGSEFTKPKRAEGKHIDVSQQTLDYMQMGMSATTREGGTASYFDALPKKIAGKTGTAENSHGRDHGLFVAYGPLEDPELVVVAIVEQGGFGSISAGPIVYKCFEEYFSEKGEMPGGSKESGK
ncbi:MAG: penicillin-binding protein 2 [Phascolarctobacterium sp.]|nr:penicillin-binding protein 2 [Phascolarctobacterium sp.]